MSPKDTVTTDLPLRSLLRAARDEQGLTQKQVARRARLSPSWVHRVETGNEPRISTDALLRVMMVLYIQPAHLNALPCMDGTCARWAALASELEQRWQLNLKRGPYDDEMENYIHYGPTDGKTKLALIAAYRAVRSLSD